MDCLIQLECNVFSTSSSFFLGLHCTRTIRNLFNRHPIGNLEISSPELLSPKSAIIGFSSISSPLPFPSSPLWPKKYVMLSQPPFPQAVSLMSHLPLLFASTFYCCTHCSFWSCSYLLYNSTAEGLGLLGMPFSADVTFLMHSAWLIVFSFEKGCIYSPSLCQVGIT